MSMIPDSTLTSSNSPNTKMNEEHKILNNKRKGCKARIVDFSQYIHRIMNLGFLNSSQVLELTLRIEKVESIYKQYEEIQTQLESVGVLIKPDVSAKFESEYYKYLAISRDLLHNKNKTNNISVVSGCDKSTQTCIPNQNQFPLIQVPKFNGCYGNWLDFRESFKNLIHSNNLIEDIEKFRYLQASMEDSAAELIQTVEFSASNYIVAWKLLNERFNNINILVNHHVSCLFNIQAIEKRSVIMLKEFIHQLHKNLRALELLGQPVKYWDTLLLYMFSSKLDEITRSDWIEYSLKISKDDSSITFDMFLEFIRTHVDLIEATEITKNEKDSII